ncbi:Sulfotransferase family cytosolic 1B member 1 like protein [Argiope bruennichi]|uniref:Sulfotransferase family cytosolic 1B member 1 like protein n=1 Tax=Argiope bruennichi TaxID=94029 RepID=A0A8T0F7Y1_ARGBR|nr:Sulfotransferase family cytosolic 1B member 1 like protein [Argiope bruennichi]
MAPTQIIRGLPFPKASWFPVKNIEDTLDYVPHDGDIIVASYPKTGTTWLEYIVFQIISKGELFPSFDECLYKYAPFLELVGTAVLGNMEKPRIFKHHCPYNMVQKNDKAKYVYIYRKPEDTIISYYHFARNLWLEPPELDEFFEDFITGNISYGHYFDHVLSYFAHKDDENVLLVSYEKLLLHKREEILRIAKYLGDVYYQTLSENESIMDKVLEHTSFDYMKKNLSLTHPGKECAERKVNFFRKGTIGDGKHSLKPDQLKRLKDLALKRLEGTDLLKEWLDELKLYLSKFDYEFPMSSTIFQK